MRRTILSLCLLLMFVSGLQSAFGQLLIKLPEVPRVNRTPEQPRKNGVRSASNEQGYLQRPVASSKAILLRETVEIKPYTKESYWKFPNQGNYTSWVPQIDFRSFYDGSSTLRYAAEWTNADGSPWFTEALRYQMNGDQTASLRSEYSDEIFNTKAVTAIGTYSVKVTDTKSGEVVFQGKFRVNKKPFAPGDISLKNRNIFYVDNDWNLPVGYVGFNYDSTWDYLQPTVFMWFKGRIKAEDFEGRLFYNGQEIASTDGGGWVNTSQYRGDDCTKYGQDCRLQLTTFMWNKFMLENSNWVRRQKPDSLFTNDRPGQYTVKVFYKAQQVREANFTIDQAGHIAPNQFSNQIYLANYRV
ncbi:MAG TPA: hypothetical protein VEV84_16120, partial [Pyrinomonadaceae bacterium]|nr:hypothetical protein [Pyrinomonadaceae bacterium]